jgi:signal transduction histidine kinase
LDVASGALGLDVASDTEGLDLAGDLDTTLALDLGDAASLRLENVVDRGALGELAASFERLFHVGVRIVALDGLLLADARAVSAPWDDALAATLASRPVVARTITTQAERTFRVEPIVYDGRPMAAFVLGPFTLACDSAGRTGLASVDETTLGELTRHLAITLDLLLFSGHKAHVTMRMHLLSVEESYRELAEKNARLAEAYERLRELDRLKSNFLANVSHELRTPLTSIMGYSEMLAEGVAGPLIGEQAEFVGVIREKGEQLLGLIMSLLDLAKLENGTMPVRSAEVSIPSVLAEAISTLMPVATKKGVRVVAEAEEGMATLQADPDRLRQVFINLLDNAVKFTSAGGLVRLAARTRLVEPDDSDGLVLVAPTRKAVEVRVSDTGLGIAPEERQRVFDPFYQVDPSSTRQHGGAGLGLSIVKRLIDAHGGSIHVEPNDPHGTVFVVVLPANRSAATPPAQGSRPPLSRSADATGQHESWPVEVD